MSEEPRIPHLYPLWDENTAKHVGQGGVWLYRRPEHEAQLPLILSGSFVLVAHEYEASIIVMRPLFPGAPGYAIEIQDDDGQEQFNDVDELIAYLSTKGITIHTGPALLE